jgi:alpha-methylacyl-CoA racemase
MTEAQQHPHIKARKTFVDVAGSPQPAPVPRFSRTEAKIAGPPPHAGQHTDEILAQFGFAPAEIAKLREVRAVK